MMDMIRSFGDNVRWFLRKFRPAPRFTSRIAVKVSFVEYALAKNNVAPIPIMDGQTFNMSESGLALLVPDVYLENRSLVADDTQLLVVLDLPNGLTRLHAVPIHFRRADKYVRNAGYVVGLKITKMEGKHHARYLRFIDRTRRGEKVSTQPRAKSELLFRDKL